MTENMESLILDHLRHIRAGQDAMREGRSGTGDEIARAVMLLVDNGYITGQTVAVNGGSLFS